MLPRPAEKSPWLKRVLIPFWVVQFVLTSVLLGCSCYTSTSGISRYVRRIQQSFNDPQDTDCGSSTELILIITCITCILLNITEITLFAIHRLNPVTYLVFQIVQIVIWLVVLIISIIITMNQLRIGYAWYSLGLLVVFNGLLEAVILLYVINQFSAFSRCPDESVKRGI